MKTFEQRSQGTDGFSLVEVISILAVTGCLVLLVAPALAKSETRGLNTACRNNQRLMMAAFHMYADENDSYFPGNSDLFGAWISIYEPASVTNALTPRNFAFAPYVPPNQNILKCPADSSLTSGARRQPRLRSISMSQAVGTKGGSKDPVDGYWLSGGGHVANRQFYCYGKISDMVDPTPAGLWVFIEEHPDSINDGGFGNVGLSTPQRYEWIDYPAGWHGGAAIIGFADGHAEEKKWVDPRTLLPIGRTPSRTVQPNNHDIEWLAKRTTSPVPR